ncbi:ABC transporter ATP-binding protein [Oceanotoga teriensis]|uniref:ABC transporter ATP-binding protein n=1 Tax=Oceanotoga teriensis TaxID=515440 RepID=UPI0027132215|nr:ABC transporter ATP-binding protein [Oceanotoga teriensis]MDO7975468.1 ABC transporter ATP-binding protein [Oceanotoga teriensis]
MSQPEINIKDYAIYMKDITKQFPKVLANNKVNLKVKKGEIHALIGENGAGKSTLMNQLYGLYKPTSGEIYIMGEKVEINGPKDAILKGVGMVHQHFMLVDNLTVAENVILGSEPKKGISLNLKKAREEVKKLSDRYGLYVDVDAKIEDIPVGMQQRVEIIKTLYRGAEILILDEPTAVLTPQEIEDIFEIMNKLRDDGKTIIFISHKLHEVMKISDNITVMRLGEVTGHVNVKDTNEKQLANMMVGREVVLRVDKPEKTPGEKLVKIENLWVKDNRHLDTVRGINFEIKKGEILGIAGVAGNGQSELVEALTGLRKIEKGNYYFKEKEISKYNVRELREENITHIPEDRFKYAMIQEYPNYYNMILGKHYLEPFAYRGFLQHENILKRSETLVKNFDVRPADSTIATGNLSGGNQQKVVISREVSAGPEFIIIAQPTRGLDVGAIEYVHNEIINLRQKDVAVLLVSMELEEVLSLSDRIIVMYEGQIMGEVKPEEVSIEEIGLMMTGNKLKDIKLSEDTKSHHGGDK